jgi:hypothetical protein
MLKKSWFIFINTPPSTLHSQKKKGRERELATFEIMCGEKRDKNSYMQTCSSHDITHQNNASSSAVSLSQHK